MLFEGSVQEAGRVGSGSIVKRWWVSIGAVVVAAAAAAEGLSATKPLLAARVDPKAFGTQDITITTVSALSFSLETLGTVFDYNISGSQGVYCDGCVAYPASYWAQLSIPAGAVIEAIGLNT